ncbi:hypothetical protein LTR50_003835 [Elasticomyces elasticus]|nr:hypothetical protein LTR50_003835 [Elasticomyces elasticus]
MLLHSYAIPFMLALYSFAFLVSATTLPDGLLKRQVPMEPNGVVTMTSPNGASIRYKEPGKDGVCETTQGVNSYSGYISLNATTNMFFWFFEARENASTAPLTLWLNGGPGSDSLIGLFQENGPCSITANLTSMVNRYSWNNISNMLYLSQPIGVGFSYAITKVGHDPNINYLGVDLQPSDGRFSFVDPGRYDTTYLAAVGAWEILQAFLAKLPTLDATVSNRTFHLWTESYDGHYGPVFYQYFDEQVAKIANGSINGSALTMGTLGIGNGIIDEFIQTPYYPEFAMHNTYGIKAYNDTMYNFSKMAYSVPGGCAGKTYLHYRYKMPADSSVPEWLKNCALLKSSTPLGRTYCSSATNLCRSMVERIYYLYSGRSQYDIRHSYPDPTPPNYFVDYLNLNSTQQAIGVDLNYTADFSQLVSSGFFNSGDFAYPIFKTSLEYLLSKGVQVLLYYGDADYICNWFGGEAVSLALNYTHSAAFRASGYTPFVVDGTEYGEVRQYGNLAFVRVYESGHEVPFYQPKASLELFRRSLAGLTIADGKEAATECYGTNGTANATHVEALVPSPLCTGTSCHI